MARTTRAIWSAAARLPRKAATARATAASGTGSPTSQRTSLVQTKRAVAGCSASVSSTARPCTMAPAKGSSARPRKSFWYWSCQASTKANSPVSGSRRAAVDRLARRHRPAGQGPRRFPDIGIDIAGRAGPRHRAARPGWCGRRRNRPGGRGYAAPAVRARSSRSARRRGSSGC